MLCIHPGFTESVDGFPVYPKLHTQLLFKLTIAFMSKHFVHIPSTPHSMHSEPQIFKHPTTVEVEEGLPLNPLLQTHRLLPSTSAFESTHFTHNTPEQLAQRGAQGMIQPEPPSAIAGVPAYPVLHTQTPDFTSEFIS